MDPRSRLARGVLAFALAFLASAPVRANEGAPAGEASSATSTTTSTSTERSRGASAPPAEQPSTEIAPVELPEQVVRVPAAEATQDPTGAVTVVPAARFAGEAKSVAALIATAPGVAVQDYGGLGQLSTVSIRGAAASGVLVLVDGLPLNTAMSAGVDLSTVPRHWIDRVEILRGAEGAHYGSGALGGVVNLVTRGPGAGGWSAEATGGAFGTWGLAAETSRDAGPGTLLVSASAGGTGGAFDYVYDPTPNGKSDPSVAAVRDNNAASRAGLLVKWARPGARRVDALLQVSGGQRGLPGTMYHLDPDAWQADGRALASVRVAAAGPLDGTAALRVSARGDLLDLHGTTAGDTRQRGGAASTEGELRLPHPRGAALATVALEGEALGGTSETHTRASVAASLSDDLDATTWLRVAPAFRAEQVGPFTGFSGKLGASARLRGPLSVRASAGRTFRAPGFAELYLEQGTVAPNPDLVPETGLGGDAALVFDGGGLLASVGGHATVYDDLIYWAQSFDGRFKPFNAGKSLVSGLEVELATAPARRLLGLAVSGSYTWLHTEMLRGDADTLGKEIPHRAPHRLFARVAVGADRLVGAWTEFHVVSRQFEDSKNEKLIAAAQVWNAGASLRLSRSPAVSLHLSVDNVADDRSLQDGFGNPLPGRTVLLTVRAGSTQEGRP